VADEALTAGAVARRLGVAVTTLRTWHQRYGLGPSHHVPGQHRRYTSEDMHRLQVMRRLTAQGVAPAEAAAWARRVPVPVDGAIPAATEPASQEARTEQASPQGLPPGGNTPPGPTPQRRATGDPSGSVPGDQPAPDPTDAGTRPSSGNRSDSALGASGGPHPSGGPVAPGLPDPAERLTPGERGPGSAGQSAGEGAADPPAGDKRSGREASASPFSRPGDRLPIIDAVWPEQNGRMFVARDGGGHAIPTGRAGPAARGLARAAMRLDGPALRDILEMTVTDRGVVATWEEVIMPVLIGVGERYAATKRFIEVEHLLSRGVTEVLASVSRPPSSQIPRVLLAAADEEQHTLPLEALAAALAQAGVASRLLGARVPAQALVDAISRTGPAVLVLWSQLPGSADPAQWSHVLTHRHRPLLVAAAGPGWRLDHLPEEVTPLHSLGEAVRRVSAVAQPADRQR